MTTIKSPLLAHLSNDEYNLLIERYDSGEKVTKLLSEFNIRSSTQKFYTLLPPILIPDLLCRWCAIPMICYRSNERRHRPRENAHCQNCNHTMRHFCQCKKCIEEKINATFHNARKERQKIIEYIDCINDNIKEKALTDVSLEQAVALLALSRTGAYKMTQEGYVLDQLNSAPIPFAPSNSIMGYLKLLINAGLVGLSRESRSDAFICESSGVTAFNPFAVNYLFPAHIMDSLLTDIEAITISCTFPDNWASSIVDTWLDVSFGECLEYYFHLQEERKFQKSAEGGLHRMIRNILQSFSVEQCFRIMTKGAQETSDFVNREQANKKHAANYMLGACQRYADRVRTNNWSLHPVKQVEKLKRSMISYVLFDAFLKIDRERYTICPVLVSNTTAEETAPLLE